MKQVETLIEIDEFLKSSDIALLYLSRPDCNVCKSLLPKVEGMLKDFPEIKSRYVDLDSIPEASGRFSIFTIPAILLYIRGKETIREARYISVEALRSSIERYYSFLFV